MRQYSLNTTSRILIALFSLALPFSYYLNLADHTYFTFSGLLLSLALNGLLYWACGDFATRHPIAWMVNLIVGLFFCARLYGLAAQPSWFLGWERLTPEIFNQALIYIILGCSVCYLGIAHGSRLAGRPTPSPRSPALDFRGGYAMLVSFAVLVMIVTLLEFKIVGFKGASGSGEGLNPISRYLLPFFDTTIAVILVLTAFFSLRSPSVKERRLLYLTLAMLIIRITYTGHRSGIFEAFVLVLSALLFLKKEIKFHFSVRRGVLILLLLISAPYFYKLATQKRALEWFARGLYDKEELQMQFLSTLSYRISLMETTLYPMFGVELGLYDVSDLVNPETTLKSTLNRILPGKPFPDVMFSEHAYGFIYQEGGAVAYVSGDETHYTGYEWGMMGISYQLFGYGGGLFFNYLMCLILAYVAQSCWNRRSFASLSFGVLFTYGMQMWVRNLGVDNFMDKMWRFSIVLALYLIAYHLIAAQQRSQSVCESNPNYMRA